MLKVERSSIPDFDGSWQKWTRCRVCGRRICVNNYADHRVRLPKVRGVIMCPWCKGRDKGDFISAMMSFCEQVANRKCEKILVAGEACGKCPPCVAKKIMLKSPEAKAVLKRQAKRADIAQRQRQET